MPICCMCHEDKPEDAFAFRSLATGERQSHCRDCHAAYRRQHYLDNREIYIAREVARIDGYREQNRVLLYEYLREHPCVDCGETDVRVLEFDHRDPTTKRQSIGHLAARKRRQLVLAEIEKCDVRCVNCHRRRTAHQFLWSKASTAELPQANDRSPVLRMEAVAHGLRRCARCGDMKRVSEFYVKNKRTGRRATICRSCANAYGREHYRRNREAYLARAKNSRARLRGRNKTRVLNYLKGKTCVDCGEDDPLLLEFDHRDGRQKEDDVARLVMDCQWAKVEAEIAKCDIRCANCHRRRTAAQLCWARHELYTTAVEQRAVTESGVGEKDAAA